ncbi:MAG TPA: Ig-like domain-containing protein, partial [Gemmatimonadales bacterium]|nr:Ig-like domain-containing protein [Gemmatimonadales bacterium]
MTFKHKLSQRLARLWVTIAVMALGCERPLPTGQTAGNAPVATVAVTPPTGSVMVGQTMGFSATPKDLSGAPLSGRVVTWGTTNPAVATVNGSGVVTGIAAGPVTVTATSEGKIGTALVTAMNAPVASVVVSPATVTVRVGETVPLTATPKDASGTPLSGRVVTWATSNGAVATVSGNGVVTGVAAGPVSVTATSEGQSGSSAVTVTVVPVASVVVSPATASLSNGQTVQLTATPKDASGTPLSGRVVTWATSNAAVATVSGSGLVTGSGAGTATITATSEGQSGASAVTVTVVPVASVAVSPATASLSNGQTVQLTATPKDASGTPLSGRVVTWATSNAAVATVSGSGLVTGRGAGTATITATSEGQSGASAVTVTVVPVASVAVSPASASVGTLQTVQLTATPKDASGTPLSGRVVTWATSNAAVA